jgi:small subunit ribosomal protein S13
MQICQELGINPDTPAGKLTEEEVARIANLIDRKHVVEGQLRRQIAQNVARLKNIRCYRGLRHIRTSRARPTHPEQRPDAQGTRRRPGKRSARR